MAVAFSLLAFSCSGNGSDSNPQLPDPGEGGPPGGDGPEPVTLGFNPGPFTIPGGFGDLRGVAASTDYVYVADDANVYAFNKSGTFVNFAPAPATIKAIAVLPPAPEVDLPGDPSYGVANFPVILHAPVSNYGYLTVYPPNLDTSTTVEDAVTANANRTGALPNGQIDPPVPDAEWAVTEVFDMTIDRFGSILVTATTLDKVNGTLFPHGLQVFNRFIGYTFEPNIAPFVFHRSDDWGIGDSPGPIGPNGVGMLGTIATDTFFPFNRTEVQYNLYMGATNFLRDYVGVGNVTLNVNAPNPTYTMSFWQDNGFGYNRVIGSGTGSAPGSFSADPPFNPDGGFEDPDLNAGGPSGMNTDPLTDNVYICDPGNRRVQVFNRASGEFIRQIGDGTRGRAGSSFVAPSSVSIDYNGNIWICDVSDLRILREGGDPAYQFGNVGGTVRRLDNGNRLEGTTITLGNEFGAIDFRTSNINGDYLFSNMLVGSYYLTASKFNYDSDTTTVNIIADETVRIDFNLNPRTQAVTGSYTGHIIDANTNLDLEGVNVHIVNTSMSTVSDSLGGFLILNIQPGTFQVVFTRDGYETQTRDVEISAGVVTTDPIIEMVPLPLL